MHGGGCHSGSDLEEEAACQAVAMLQDESIDVAIVVLMAGTFLSPYRAAANRVVLDDDAAMAKAYLVGMVMPHDVKEEDSDIEDIEAPSTAKTTWRSCR
jgi:hypothetical protein